VRRTLAILFDATGTLITVRGDVGERYARTAAAHGIRLAPDRASSAFAAALAAAPPLCFPGVPSALRDEAARGWWREIVRATVEASLVQPSDPHAPERTLPSPSGSPPVRGPSVRAGDSALEALFDDLYASFGSGRAWTAAEGTGPVLAELARRGYRLGVLSNSDARLPGILAALGLTGYLARVETSVGLGVAKPDPESFRRALAGLGVSAEDAAYVGDSPESDALGAARAGLLPVLLRAALPAGITGHTIARLPELLDLFPDTLDT
jgi:putative hydrolase of the HAD superfamily